MPESGKRRRSFVPCRVLVVEDDDAFAEALAELLATDERIEVVGRARDGLAASELVDELDPDLVLMDVVLPLLDGVEATRAIRERHSSIPVVALTGLEYEERALEVREAGADEFLRKGRLDSDLTETVLSLARRRRSARRRESTR
jgi:DNA-binding NarL/FixJ family response regulator